MNTIVVVLAAALGFAQQNDDLARLELIAIPSVSSNVVEVNRAVDFLSAIDPSQFVPHRENGRIYGRGASDCKEHIVLCVRP